MRCNKCDCCNFQKEIVCISGPRGATGPTGAPYDPTSALSQYNAQANISDQR